MRRSPRLALALLLAATPVMAQEKATDTAARSFKVSWAAPCPDAVETQVCCEVKFIRVSDAMLKHLRFQSAPSAPQPNQRESATGLIRVGACCDAEAPDEKRRVQFASSPDPGRTANFASGPDLERTAKFASGPNTVWARSAQ